MGVEVKSGGEGVIVADRGCNDGCCCDLKNGQQEIKCLIENTAKDQENCPSQPSSRFSERPEHYPVSSCSS